MAHSKRNEAQQQAATEVEAAETLNLGHAGLRSECWPGTGGMGSSCCDSESASPRAAVLRLHRPRGSAPRYTVRDRRKQPKRDSPQTTMNLHNELSAVESALSRTFTGRKRSTTGCVLSGFSRCSNIGGMRDNDRYGAELLHDYPRRFPWAQQLGGSPWPK